MSATKPSSKNWIYVSNFKKVQAAGLKSSAAKKILTWGQVRFIEIGKVKIYDRF